MLIYSNLAPLTKYQFDVGLQRCLECMGLGNLSFSSHSFRIGAASEAAQRGLKESAIMEMGNAPKNASTNAVLKSNTSYGEKQTTIVTSQRPLRMSRETGLLLSDTKVILL